MLWTAKIKQTITLLHSQTRAEHKHGKSVLSSNVNTKLTLIWMSEKASQTTLNTFLCKRNLDHMCQNIKAVTQQFVSTNLHVSCLNKCIKELVVHVEQEFSFSTFAAHFKCPNLFLLFLNILKGLKKFFKHFVAALLSAMESQHYSDFDFSWPIKTWHFLFLQ